MKRLFQILLFYLLIAGCARQTQPSGGPKDQDPPTLVNSIPKNGQKNFKGKQIDLEFNEFIKLKDPKEEILITPSFGVNTKFLAKKNRVIITPELPLQDTTTYSIAFRNGIQDINESNPAEDLHLAFSTGPVIDSLTLLGTITEVFTEKKPEKITVALYQSDTFDIFQHKPPIFTKVNKQAKFAFSNLKPGTYYIYAFDDKNKNQKIDSKSERYGFLTTPVKLPENRDSVQIQIYRLDARPFKLTSVRNSSTISLVRFNKAIDSIKISSSKPVLYTYGDDQSEIVFYKDFDKNDSLKVTLSVKDSINQQLDSAVYIKYTDAKTLPGKFKIPEWQVSFDPSNSTFKAQTKPNKLVTSVNLDSIYIQIDSTTFEPLIRKEIQIDTLKKVITINKKLPINLKEKLPDPILVFGKGALVSINQDSSAAAEVTIKIPKPEGTGTVTLELNTSAPHFFTQMLTTKNDVAYLSNNQKKFTFAFVNPSEYKIAVIKDDNNNHRWDPGNFYKHQQAEKVTLYRSLENKYVFPVRANWEIGPLNITF